MTDPRGIEEAVGDMSDWEEIPNAIRRGKASSVFSLRISASELSLINAAARRNGTTLSEFIRKAALSAALQGDSGQIAMSREDATLLHSILESVIKVEAI